MKKLYSSPTRVYILLGVLALLGVYCGFQLPVSLFPNSSKPLVWVSMGYENITAKEFIDLYGRSLEAQLRGISTNSVRVEEFDASYDTQQAVYSISFKWGVPYDIALREVQAVVNGFSGRLPKEIRDTVAVSPDGQNGGFFLASFYSSKRDLNSLYRVLEPVLKARLSKIQDVDQPQLWNPSQREIQIELNPEKMAAFQLYPRDIKTIVMSSLLGGNGGSIKMGFNRLDVNMERSVKSIKDLERILIRTPKGRAVRLSEVARIDLGVPTTQTQIYKTSGVPCLILFAAPKPGGNVKKMAEDIIKALEELKPSLPDDVEYKVTIDPSEFIRSAVYNVLREVVIAAGLAVFILFLFIGNLKNVVTAAVEIPMSIVLAFILMRFSGINLNLVSLGGLALSAGMNVDASVVVMENIFRHFETVEGNIDYSTRLRLVLKAVGEVWLPIITSTIASIVVFLPMAFTAGLTNGLLSDLALAVVFSHGFSAVVALLLVPTVRLHLMSNEKTTPHKSPIDGLLRLIERVYKTLLSGFIRNKSIKYIVYLSLAGTLFYLVQNILPKLPREIIGRPDTDRLVLSIYTQGNKTVRQMESQVEEIDARLTAKFGDRLKYTFTRILQPNVAKINSRLKDKKEMVALWKEFESFFKNTPTVKFSIEPWNPSELTIPNPPQMSLGIRGRTSDERNEAAREIAALLEDKKVFKNLDIKPDIDRREGLTLIPNLEQWSNLERSGARVTTDDLTDLSRVATSGQKIFELAVDGEMVPIVMQYPTNRVGTVEDLGRLPIGVNEKLLPFKALSKMKIKELEPSVYRLNENDIVLIEGRVKKENESKGEEALTQAREIVGDWLAKKKGNLGSVAVEFEDAKKELTLALSELEKAGIISIVLIFLTMVLQFGGVVDALLVLIAIPLGFIGVILSLYFFKSTLSLNSGLGVILLNGIAVANSILLVDQLKRMVNEGLSPHQAAIAATQKRLRPILMTSLTTVLAMLPVALGIGEGGKILQPLGIAVIGGMAFSTCFTLFIVPALQVSYLEFSGRSGQNESLIKSPILDLPPVPNISILKSEFEVKSNSEANNSEKTPKERKAQS